MKHILLTLLLLTACRDETIAIPEPVSLTPDAVGFYCQMDLLEHPGPKAQVHVRGLLAPLFFSQVRDAIAYQRMPEQSYAVAVIYVNDMGVAPSWANTGPDNWIKADTALYVIGSKFAGGMGAPELVPFADRTKAQAFATSHGGHIVTLAEISDADVLTPVASKGESDTNEDPDYTARLRSLSSKAGG